MFTLKKNSVKAKFEHLHHWIAVVGYVLPRTDGEMARFDKLYKDYIPEHSIDQLDLKKIWNDEDQFKRTFSASVVKPNFGSLKMAARGLKDLPDEVRKKVLYNQKIAKDETERKNKK